MRTKDIFHGKIKVAIALTLGISLALAACKDIFETNISNYQLQIVSPADNLRSQTNSVTFWWEKIDDAISYRLQIVSPNFNKAERFIVDTALKTNTFAYVLSPGLYQWRLRAENGSSKTEYFTRTIQIDSTLDLTNQVIVLTYPYIADALNKSKITFKWANLYNASEYNFEIRTPDWSGSKVFNSYTTTYDTITISSISEGNYEWGVRAINNSSISNFTTRKLIIDLTAPSAPTLVSPEDKKKLSLWPLIFTWKQVQDSGSTLIDSIYVASDSIFSQISLSRQSSTQTISLDSTEISTGTYFWKVKTADKAGNSSKFSSYRKLYINAK